MIGDAQLAGGQADRADEAVGEVDGVGPGLSVGVEDRLAQRAVAAVGQVQDREGAEQAAIFQAFEY
jgi:hypothetical protein